MTSVCPSSTIAGLAGVRSVNRPDGGRDLRKGVASELGANGDFCGVHDTVEKDVGHYDFSATAFNWAKPFSKSLPHILSMLKKVVMTLDM